MIEANVIIVGTGPVGLSLAYQLQRANLSVLAFDSKPRSGARDKRSKALSMSPGTLEILASLGIADQFLQKGFAIPETTFRGCATKIRLGADVLGTRHPHMLWLPQADTETILLDACTASGVQFAWAREFVGLRQNQDHVLVTAKQVGTDEDGEETYKAHWLIGCDGTHSVVRSVAGIAFEGTPATFSSWIADFHVTSRPSSSPLAVSNDLGSAMMMPVPGREYFRAFGITYAAMHLPVSQMPTEEEIAQHLKDILGSDIGMHNPVWLSRFGDASRVASTFRANRVFIAGDAAHQHFPAGGQGMNIGIQDANNLAWKLASAEKCGPGPHTERILDSYSAERRAATLAVMANVNAQVHTIKAHDPCELAIRAVFAEALENPAINELWALRLSGFGDPTAPHVDFYRQSQSGTRSMTGDIEWVHPLIGQRVTHLQRDEKRNPMHEAGAAGHFAVIRLKTQGSQCSEELLQRCCAPWKESVVVLAAAASPCHPKWNDVVAILVRPDQRIAWVGQTALTTEQVEGSLENTLRAWLD